MSYKGLVESLTKKTETQIVMLILDGLGDCDNDGKGTALQLARIPNMDELSKKSALGLHIPVDIGITPGSGPGHFALFGYDPVEYQVGRGVLSALGLGFDLEEKDVAARINFCTIDSAGRVIDRRAGRINDEENKRLIEKIKKGLEVPDGIEIFFETEAEHRALLVIRGENLDADVGDTDPQATGVMPLKADRPPYERSRTAKIYEDIARQVKCILSDEPRANMILARGFAKLPLWPKISERFKLNPCAIAGYPMYRGVAKIVGIPVISQPKNAVEVCREIVKALQAGYTFIFAHYKYTDKTGEDGDLSAKIKAIEDMDSALPILFEADPDVLIITGDHSTPPSLKAHSWHPVPLMMKAPYLRGGDGPGFDEIKCRYGQIGIIKAIDLLPLAMAHAGKLEKFGA